MKLIDEVHCIVHLMVHLQHSDEDRLFAECDILSVSFVKHFEHSSQFKCLLMHISCVNIVVCVAVVDVLSIGCTTAIIHQLKQSHLLEYSGHCCSKQNMYQSDAVYHQTCINLSRFITHSSDANPYKNVDPEQTTESVVGKVSLFNCCSFQICQKRGYWPNSVNLDV